MALEPVYRCFFRDEDNKVLRLDLAELPDDATALVWGADLLRRRPHKRGCEVWEGKRLVRWLDQGQLLRDAASAQF